MLGVVIVSLEYKILGREGFHHLQDHREHTKICGCWNIRTMTTGAKLPRFTFDGMATFDRGRLVSFSECVFSLSDLCSWSEFHSPTRDILAPYPEKNPDGTASIVLEYEVFQAPTVCALGVQSHGELTPQRPADTPLCKTCRDPLSDDNSCV